jgi:hypothetical protein
MAEKVVLRRRKKAPPPADDLAILHPEQHIRIAGHDLVVREYGFVEGLRLRPQVQPLLDDLYALLQRQGSLELEDVIVALARNHEMLLDLLAIAADVEPAFVHGLSQNDGYALLLAWWAANGPFFISALITRKAAQQAAAQRAGATSTAS